MKDLVKAFIIGSSWMTFALFFRGFHTYKGKFNKENCIENILGVEPYYFYTMTAPVGIGVMSMLAVYLNKKYKIPLNTSFLITSAITTTLVSTAITWCKVYDFTEKRLREQYMRLVFYHLFLFLVIIMSIHRYIEDNK